MTWEELNSTYADFFIDQHPDQFVIRNNPGSLAYFRLICRLPAAIVPYETETILQPDGSEQIVRYFSYQNLAQFGERSAPFTWKSVECQGITEYIPDFQR